VNAGEEEMMKSPYTQEAAGKVASEQGELVRRYREIGISAVAGALACEREAKKSAPVRVERRIKERELQISA
jgi:hypothetical protein